MINPCLFSAVLLLLQNGLLAVPMIIEHHDYSEKAYQNVIYTPQVTDVTYSAPTQSYTIIPPSSPTTIVSDYSSQPTGSASPTHDSEYADVTVVSVEIEEECEVDDEYSNDNSSSYDENYDDQVDDYSNGNSLPKDQDYDDQEDDYSNEEASPSEETYDQENYTSTEPNSNEQYTAPSTKEPSKGENYQESEGNGNISPHQPTNYITDKGTKEGHWECRWVKVPYKPRPGGPRPLIRRFKAPVVRIRRNNMPRKNVNYRRNYMPMRRRRSVLYFPEYM